MKPSPKTGESDLPRFHRGVAVVLRQNGRILLAQRAPDRRWAPGTWDVPGGHLEGSESELDAAAREIREELGVSLEISRESFLGRLRGIDFDVAYFVASTWAGHPQNTAPAEQVRLAWFSVEDLGQLLLSDPDVLPILRTAFG